jgi:hypothetical protein
MIPQIYWAVSLISLTGINSVLVTKKKKYYEKLAFSGNENFIL